MSDFGIKNQKVAAEHARWTRIIGPADPYLTKVTIGIHEVLHAHFLLVDYFNEIGEGIGGVGPKDVGLVHSALGRQFVEFGGRAKWKDRISICASLMFGLIKNHPFHDANKRTAFLVALLHLQKIGRTPIVSGQVIEDFTVDVADDKLGSYEGYDQPGLVGRDREVGAMAKFLKKSTREVDLRTKVITFNELSAILSKRGYSIEKPNGNRIDVVRKMDPDGRYLASPKRVAHIGFHGWSKEVSRKDIDIVREATRLDARHGYDSQSFFNGMDDPLTMIVKYKDPLERLAFR